MSIPHGTGELFNVVQFFTDGTSEYVRRMVPPQEAVAAAKHYTESVAVRMGMVERVIITDMGDLTVFEWKKGQGITFPPQAEGRQFPPGHSDR